MTLPKKKQMNLDFLPHPKPLREKCPDNLALVRAMPCLICQRPSTKTIPSDVDHWKTRGSGGSDSLSNLSPFCRYHHTLKGQIGVKTFYTKYKTLIEEARKAYGLPPLEVKDE